MDASGENGLYDDNVDKIVLEGFYVNDSNRHYTISMNGTIFYATSKTSPLRKVYGLSYSEYMTGFDNDSITLFGNAGDDTYIVSEGCDTISQV